MVHVAVWFCELTNFRNPEYLVTRVQDDIIVIVVEEEERVMVKTQKLPCVLKVESLSSTRA